MLIFVMSQMCVVYLEQRLLLSLDWESYCYIQQAKAVPEVNPQSYI